MTSDYFRLKRDSGQYPRFLPSPASLSNFIIGPDERAYLDDIGNREVVGTPSEVREQILQRALRYQADEVMLSTMAHSLHDKLEAFRLLAEVFDLCPLSKAEV